MQGENAGGHKKEKSRSQLLTSGLGTYVGETPNQSKILPKPDTGTSLRKHQYSDAAEDPAGAGQGPTKRNKLTLVSQQSLLSLVDKNRKNNQSSSSDGAVCVVVEGERNINGLENSACKRTSKGKADNPENTRARCLYRLIHTDSTN